VPVKWRKELGKNNLERIIMNKRMSGENCRAHIFHAHIRVETVYPRESNA
jgi:hypothetical protein